MPLVSIEARNRSLDNDYGVTAGPHAASGHLLALYAGDPLTGGVEADPDGFPGYARAEVPFTAWADAVDGIKATTSPVEFPQPTGEWESDLTHFALIDAEDPTVVWDAAPLRAPLSVTGAGEGPTVAVALFYDDDARDQEDT